jgi:Ran GTPase-activating protein (RanGAP) involved in mRNA processing and transport
MQCQHRLTISLSRVLSCFRRRDLSLPTMSLPWRFSTAQEYVDGTVARLNEAPPSYKHLNIGKYFLSEVDALTHNHLRDILEAATKNPHIDELTLSGIQSQSADNDAANSSAFLVTMSRLSVLLQSRPWKRVTFTACGGEVIPLALSGEKQVYIKEIRLTNYETLPIRAMVALKRNMQQIHSSLEHLVLSEVNMDVHWRVIRPLAQGIASSSSLKTLEIKYCTINDEAIDILSTQGLSKNRSLEALHMPGCELEDEAVKMVVVGISHHPTLKILTLFRNHCGEGGVQALANLLLPLENNDPRGTTRLETLDLSYQQFERDRKLNVELLANSLAQNKTLKNLVMAFNKLNDKDAVCLAMGLQSHSQLVELDLRANNIRDVGAVMLAEKVLKCLPNLRKFCLYGNPLGEMGAHKLLEAIQVNTEVEIINMDYGMPAYDKIHYYAYLNQVGRRLMKEEDLNPALWTVVLQRAQRLSLETRGVCSAADLIYPFIRESTMFNRDMNSQNNRT